MTRIEAIEVSRAARRAAREDPGITNVSEILSAVVARLGRPVEDDERLVAVSAYWIALREASGG
jgi:hypothetical protein